MVQARADAYETTLLEVWHEQRLEQLRGMPETSADAKILERMDKVFGRFLLDREPEPDPRRRHVVELAINKMANFATNFNAQLANRFELIPG